MSAGTRLNVYKALQLMAKMNDVIQDTHGNVSEIDRSKTEDMMHIKPSGIPYKDIKSRDICTIFFKNVTWQNEFEPSVDSIHHQKIYENNPHIKAICHTHSPYAVAYAITGRDIVCITTEQADYFGGDINCRPYQDLNNWGNFSVEPHEYAVLLGNHGVLTFGKNAVHAVKLAAALENVARKNYLAETLSKTTIPLSLSEINKWHERYNNVYGQKDPVHS